MYRCDISFVWMCIPVELRGDDAGGHGWNVDLLGGANCIHFFVGEFDLPRVDIVDQFVALHDIDANNVVVQLVDDVYWVRKLLSFDIKVHLIDSNGVHCILRSGDAALRVGDFLGFLVSKCGVERSALHAGDSCSCVK